MKLLFYPDEWLTKEVKPFNFEEHDAKVIENQMIIYLLIYFKLMNQFILVMIQDMYIKELLEKRLILVI